MVEVIEQHGLLVYRGGVGGATIGDGGEFALYGLPLISNYG